MDEMNARDVSVERDETLDVLGAMQLTPIAAASTDTTETEEVQEEAPPVTTAPPKKEKVRAIDKAIAAKRQSTSGLFTDQKAAAEESAPKRPVYDSDEAREEFEETLGDIDDSASKAQKVVVVKKFTNPSEYAAMLAEIDAVVLDSDGNAIVPEGAQYIIARTPEIEAEIERRKERDASGKTDAKGDSEYEGQPLADVDAARKEYKDSIVRILIDKTGMGMNITFDDEDKKAIERANVIQLCEVEDMDLKVIEVDRPDDTIPFMQAVEARQLSVSKVPMTFPSSGFKADMCGLSYGEFSDIALDTDAEDAADFLSYDKLYKRYSVIYNNMKNVSVGPFKDFDDFLHSFAHDDLDLALYGLVIATQPERDTLNMSCTKPGCKKSFLYTYSPRSVIDFDTAPVAMLEAIDKISAAAPDERLTLYKNSRVKKFKRIRLPISNYLVDIGAASAWDYLYHILPVVQEYAAIEEDMSDTDPRRSIPQILFGVRAIYIPSKFGGHIPAVKGRDIADVILKLPTTDAMVLEAAVFAYRRQFSVGFSLKKIECPHCHTQTQAIAIDIGTLVFQIRLRQLSTRTAVKNFPDF